MRSFPVDKIKIDRSFVCDLASNPGSLAINRAVARLGGSLGITILIEGAETAEQYLSIKNEGCKQVQGFLFSKPLAREAIAELLSHRSDLAIMAA